ncbi:serine/arginine-rich splicing factor 11 isoform X3 [Macaca nemestrina]|uniref:Serine/arginine-rich splicing factor 11 isoform 1 n=12 Tax=Catarrhini TaxID=9526 RepID=H9G1V6_MACMU|nr:serine/arginine-rich splicing factor 11 isoform X3 [Macaca fascicularis]XP_007976508.1 serine/arginine-rich splicing factor 11 isoform X3 [Chlorocebus sabaeus]XP_007976509.1 serine/arginine-rich splicing factor 11 isoform X3 [Chlorocebus sabaeus]XP_009209028.1 serine/arginine-rich splicing factor 11 isoform X3 [Papio anubis]XP_010356963.1 serine/arginine-rich splicing factor 11 isoform X3 [Rhinopithecus roxellana]XP_011768723.1 serine/arginine-rich splicing factor 11 isoform X3 [Macaca neme
MSNTTVVPSTAGPGPSGGPGGGGGGGGGGGTEVIQVTNVSPSASSEQMRTLFGFLGKIDELRLFPPDDSPLPVSSRVCFVKFHDPDSAVVAQHLTNTVFVDRALIVVPYAEGVIPDEAKALSLLAPANAVAGLLPGGGLLPTPNPLTQIGAVPLAALGAPTLDPALAALGLPGANLNSQSLAADQLLKLMSTVDPKLNHVAAGLVSPSLKSDTSSKEIEEAMKRVREAQSLISAAIEPDKKEEKRRHSRSRSRSRRRRTPSSSRHRRSRSRSRRRSHSKSRSRRRSKSPRRRRSHSRERGRRSRSTSKTRDKKKEDKEKKRSKTPPKSYSTARRSRSASRERRRRRSRSGTRSPKKPRSPKRKLSRSPSPRRHKKEKKKDKDKERSRDERERSTSKKKKSKDKEKDRERKSESDKDVKQVTRDYDEEEQGYDSEKEKKEEKKPIETGSPKTKECSVEKGTGDSLRESKVNGDDHHEEDMDMSD